MKPRDIEVRLIRHTLPVHNAPLFDIFSTGLFTFEVDIPLYIWTELLTHRRLSRNASSARAMGTKRYADMGYYLPDKWYSQGVGMAAGDEVTDERTIRMCKDTYHGMCFDAEYNASLLSRSGIAKEQANRVIPPLKMIRGIVTGTESAWQAFLRLRKHPSADQAMQKLAHHISGLMEQSVPVSSHKHTPYDDNDATVEQAIARIARVSYARSSGKDDEALYETLLTGGHASPFEHWATWTHNPKLNNFCCMPDDVYCENKDEFPRCDFEGWEQLRQEAGL